MMDLAALQAKFQKAVVDGDDGVLEDIVDSPKESRTNLLGVYRNAYSSRLIEILATDYPKLHALLGDKQFAELAQGFVAAHPSQTSNARWFGIRFPAYLADATDYDQNILLAELAQIERALNDVFDAEDMSMLTVEDLSTISPEHWVSLSFTPHCAIRRLDLTTNAAELWQALHEETEMPEIGPLSEPQHILVSRDEGMACFRPMANDEAMMWDEAANGVAFSILCEMLAMHGGEDDAALRAAGYLQTWISAGLLSKINVA